MIHDELPMPWRFVDDLSKLSKNDTCIKCNEEEYVVQTDVTMLPSFVWVGSSFFTPISFLLRNLEDNTIINLTSQLLGYTPKVKAFTIGSSVYVAMSTQFWSALSSPLSTGTYQADISDGINHIYSEPINICSDLSHCIRMTWNSSCDVAGIPYVYLHSIVTGDFTNCMFVQDSPLLQLEYETETEENVNLLRQRVKLFQTQERTFRFKTTGPNWIVRMFKAMELHDYIVIDYQYDSDAGTYKYTSGELEDFEAQLSDIEKSECTQQIEVRFKQDDAIINGICCVSNEPDACLTSCYTVLGFYPEDTCTEGAYYMEDVDSGVIVQCVSGNPVTKTTTCTYVFNETDGNYYYYNGDLWQITPDLNYNSYTNNGDGTTTIDLDGFTIPGTWSYIQYSCDNVTFTTYPTPFTAAQLAAGISITVQTCSDTYYLKCTSQNHTCTYDTSDTIQFTPM